MHAQREPLVRWNHSFSLFQVNGQSCRVSEPSKEPQPVSVCSGTDQLTALTHFTTLLGSSACLRDKSSLVQFFSHNHHTTAGCVALGCRDNCHLSVETCKNYFIAALSPTWMSKRAKVHERFSPSFRARLQWKRDFSCDLTVHLAAPR